MLRDEEVTDDMAHTDGLTSARRVLPARFGCDRPKPLLAGEKEEL